jgi:hypothetical protein
MIAIHRLQRKLRAQRARNQCRGLLVVADSTRHSAGASPVPAGYWRRRLGVTDQLARHVRFKVRRPVPK